MLTFFRIFTPLKIMYSTYQTYFEYVLCSFTGFIAVIRNNFPKNYNINNSYSRPPSSRYRVSYVSFSLFEFEWAATKFKTRGTSDAPSSRRLLLLH